MTNQSSYAWIITHDYICDSLPIDSTRACTGQCGLKSPDCAVGVTGPHNAGNLTEKLMPGGRKFKIYDDDGIHYYTGVIYLDPDTSEGEDEFGPLDDFGTPNAGATEIRYKNDETGEWETL